MARFGSFEVDAARRQLLASGCDVHLTPKAFDLLALLIAAAPRVVPKREIHDRLWPNGLVSDSTIVGLVKELRSALADHDQAAPIIRTVHRVGYAFDAPLLTGAFSPLPWRWLVVEGRRMQLADGANVVGRDPRCDVWLDYSTVSRRHARIVVDGTAAIIEDLGSKNGTRIGADLLVGAATLRNRDRLGFGQLPAVYREAAAGVSTATRAGRLGGTLPASGE
jgi:DNA-binding winged helix-turn-helix (wHTH) protein